MCRGRIRPGYSTVLSGKSGIRRVTTLSLGAGGPRRLRRLPPVISRIDLRGKGASVVGSAAARRAYADVLPRAALDVEAALDAVRPVCDDVRARGAVAVREATLRFDGVDVPNARVPAEALAKALAEIDPAVRAALEEA